MLFFISFLENTLLPIPGEAILPVAGFLVHQGVYPYAAAVLAATAGATLGASTTYAVGRWGGVPIVKRYGHWLGITRVHLNRSERYFARYGAWTIFVCRFIPAVRQVSSLPAGAAKMRYLTFALATFCGALLWNSTLIGLGWYFGDEWERLLTYGQVLDVIGIALVLAVVVWWLRTHAPRIMKRIDDEDAKKEGRRANATPLRYSSVRQLSVRRSSVRNNPRRNKRKR